MDWFDVLMKKICDLCHHPYQVCDPEELEDLFCWKCYVKSFVEHVKNLEVELLE